ncbi:PepSY-associated TM helix domain-containing protein [Roseomonas populi]|uniref:PepSY domain-containing protein n=1 Tax=Roseomonas populi TaxID=3121582 RepID=A0ABT1XC66_9PROT|nr:PepSY domain-containing protein [Roseomonas pecuniae]MCR0985721.1 PepSY domain-containing protein [Roseomonas pecuniae]
MAAPTRSLYGMVWRWHFYAGLFVIPFLVILSLTGTVYLFEREINDALQPGLRFASSASAPSIPASAMVSAAEQTYPGGRVTRIDMPEEPGRTAQLFLTTGQGEALRVFVDPLTGQVLGSHVYERTLVGFADRMHGSLLLGDFGDAIVELAASWTLILVLSGFYLWWPRGGRMDGKWFPRLRARRRPLWRDIHQVVGLYTGALIVFLVITGLPWATIWGGQILSPVSNAVGLGYPEGSRRPMQSTTGPVAAAMPDAPWTLHQAPMPASLAGAACGTDHASHHHAGGPACPTSGSVHLDAAVQILAQAGMPDGYRLNLPRGERGVYMAVSYPHRPEGQRTIHIDQYSGEILGDVGFREYGAVAKAVELGVAIHMGRYFGLANQLLMLLPCIGILVLVTTGTVMWWKRRPKGELAAPPRVARPVPPGLLAIIGGMGIAFPLAGASMLVVGLVDAILGMGSRWMRPAVEP